jgi:hypothetical protein
MSSFQIGKYINKENMFSILIWELTIPNICLTKMPIVGNIDLCFLHQMSLDVFYIHLKSLKYHQFFIKKILCKFTDALHHLKKIQTIVFIISINKGTFNLKTMDANGDKILRTSKP